MNDLVASPANAALVTAVPSNVGSELYEAFLGGRSQNTRDAYAQDMAHFAAFLGATDAKSALSRLLGISHGQANGLLLGYRADMTKRNLTPATINRRLSAVRSAAKLGRTIGLTTWIPEVDGLKARAYRDTAGPGVEGTRAMLEAARGQGKAAAVRDAAMIRVFFDLALRCNEVVTLDVADVDFAGQRLWILGKGRTQKEPRTLPLKTVAVIREWIEVRSSLAVSDQVALFISLARPAKCKRISVRGVHYVISGLGADVGIKTRPHGLRHASITAALDSSNGDVRAVQQHARHSKPETTIRYDDNRRDLAGKIANDLAAVL